MCSSSSSSSQSSHACTCYIRLAEFIRTTCDHHGHFSEINVFSRAFQCHKARREGRKVISHVPLKLHHHHYILMARVCLSSALHCRHHHHGWQSDQSANQRRIVRLFYFLQESWIVVYVQPCSFSWGNFCFVHFQRLLKIGTTNLLYLATALCHGISCTSWNLVQFYLFEECDVACTDPIIKQPAERHPSRRGNDNLRQFFPKMIIISEMEWLCGQAIDIRCISFQSLCFHYFSRAERQPNLIMKKQFPLRK